MIARRTFFGTIGSMFVPKLVDSKPKACRTTLPLPDVDQVNVEKFYMEQYKCWRLEIITRLKHGQLWAIHTNLNNKTVNEGYSRLMYFFRRKITVTPYTKFRYSKNLQFVGWGFD